MSRDVAYRNGYMPLYAGAELVRRSGALTQFPADNLIGTLPAVPTCSSFLTSGTQRPDWTPDALGVARYVTEPLWSALVNSAVEALGCEGTYTAVKGAASVYANRTPVSLSPVAAGTLLFPAANWKLIASNPALPASMTYSVGYPDNMDVNTVIPLGSIVVNLVAGVTSMDLTGLAPGTGDLVLAPGGISAILVEATAGTNHLQFAWWPPFNTQYTGPVLDDPAAYINCATGTCTLVPHP